MELHTRSNTRAPGRRWRACWGQLMDPLSQPSRQCASCCCREPTEGYRTGSKTRLNHCGWPATSTHRDGRTITCRYVHAVQGVRHVQQPDLGLARVSGTAAQISHTGNCFGTVRRQPAVIKRLHRCHGICALLECPGGPNFHADSLVAILSRRNGAAWFCKQWRHPLAPTHRPRQWRNRCTPPNNLHQRQATSPQS